MPGVGLPAYAASVPPTIPVTRSWISFFGFSDRFDQLVDAGDALAQGSIDEVVDFGGIRVSSAVDDGPYGVGAG